MKDMKQLVVVLLMMVTMACKPCDPSQLRFTLYTDSECTTVDQNLTINYGKVPKDQYQYYSGDCEQYKQYSFTVQCLPDKLYEEVYGAEDKTCQGEPEFILEFPWNKCTSFDLQNNTWYIAQNLEDQ